MKKWVQTIGLAALSLLFLAVQNPLTVSALSDGQKQLFQENINYFNIDSCGSGSTAPSSAPTTSGADLSNVYIVGDSITERATTAYQDAIKQAGGNVTIDASGSRGLNTPGQTGNRLTGLQAIGHDKSDIAKATAIVVALGTNGGDTKSSVDDAISAIRGANNNAPIYWVDVIAVGRPDEASFNRSIVKPGNEAIYGEAQSKNYTVISWFNKVDKNDNPKSPGASPADPNGYIDNSDNLGVHPTDKGTNALASLVVSSLGDSSASSAGSAGTTLLQGCCAAQGASADGVAANTGNEQPDSALPGNDNPTKIWNYLIAQGFTPVQAAGIEGNIGAEGVYDPQNIEDPAGRTSDYSVFQTLTRTNQGYGLIGFTPGVSLMKAGTGGADWSGISKVNVTKDNFFFISTQLDVLYGYMKNSDAPSGKNMLQEYKNQATSPQSAAAAFESLVEHPRTPNPGKRGDIAAAALQKYGNGPAATAATTSTTAAACCPSGSSGPGVTLSGNSPGEKVFNYLVSQEHFSNTAAAAATGNLQQESNFSPTINNGGGYVGLAQWGAGRLTILQAKPNWQTLQVQLQYISEELHGIKKVALDKMKSDTSIEDLTYDWVYYYEGATDSTQPRGVQNYSQRLTYAKNWLGQAGGGSSATSSTSSSTSTGSGSDCSGSSNSGNGVYKNPFRDVKSLRPERIDQGVDYAGEGPVYALGSGTIENVINPGWDFGGYDAFISVKLDSGPAAGDYSYMAEACVPATNPATGATFKVGDKVTADTVICHLINPSGSGIETGWAEPPGTGFALAQSNGGYAQHFATELGENYNDLLVSLGAPSGTQQPRMGSLPANWPKWK